MKSLRVNINDWDKVVDAARLHASDPHLPIWSALANYYSVCIPSIVTDLSRKLWNLHQRIRGTQNETYQSYYDLPAFWVNACDIIDAEIARIDRVRADKVQREQRELLRRLGQSNGNK
ncbi:MAG: hypothetical protein WC052_04650 [Patescibacteria group bacterium]|jgi:hypothetical protein